MTPEKLATDNPFAAESKLPYGLPPFDKIKDEHYLPAFEAGMAEQIAEVEEIANNPDAPTFDNTLVRLELSGQLLARVALTFFNLAASDTNPVIQEIEAQVAPRLAAHQDSIYLDGDLYRRVEKVYTQRAELNLDPESAWLLERAFVTFKRAGAGLGSEDEKRLRAINEELASLTTKFQENLLADTNDLAVVVDSEAELEGLSEDSISAAQVAAAAKGLDGKYLLTLDLPTPQEELAQLKGRALRERIFKASISRCNRGNEHDNKAVLKQIATLRSEQAALLGYPTHADYIIADRTAKTGDAARDLLARLAPAAVRIAKREGEELQALLSVDEPGAKLEAWDWDLYAERVRKDRYDIDTAELREYFELNRVIEDGLFFMAEELYGLTFSERFDLPVYHEGVRVWEVFSDGEPLALFLGDFYARESKHGGAWMNFFVPQSRLLGEKSVILNCLNLSRPGKGEPTLLTPNDVRTAFHEFGHALHGLLSDVRYPRFFGVEVPADFVEFPSQVHEMWMFWPEVLGGYAKHYKTGEPLPQHLVDKLEEARRYGSGYGTTEYLSASLLDQAWHGVKQGDEMGDVEEFEAQALREAGVALSTVPPRYRSTYFAHAFAWGYSAAYYSYIWAEVLDADAVEWFKENGGLKRENGDRLRKEVLSVGGSIDSMTAYRNFRGRDPEIEPLLRRRGLE